MIHASGLLAHGNNIYARARIARAANADRWAIRGNPAADQLFTALLQPGAIANGFSTGSNLSRCGPYAVKANRATCCSGGSIPGPSAVGRLGDPCTRAHDLGFQHHWDGMVELFRWLPTLAHPSGAAMKSSYFQLCILYEYQTGSPGARCDKRSRQRHSSSNRARPFDFVKRANLLAKCQNTALPTRNPICKGISDKLLDNDMAA